MSYDKYGGLAYDSTIYQSSMMIYWCCDSTLVSMVVLAADIPESVSADGSQMRRCLWGCCAQHVV